MNITGKRQTRFYPDQNILEVNIPIQLLRRGGRTHIKTPDGQILNTSPTSDTALMRALAQAHIWLQKLEEGEFENVKALARNYGQNESYVSRVLRLTSLPPSIQESILCGNETNLLSLSELLDGVSPLWKDQQIL
ncbi:hypothetical protein M3P05_10010 [Sansalvadorimonas sp. 2012CJ34-2]|uniref:Uncharacterized protein n=1 Tax=Parendozoicomonas callyspongiae TaxID=2942213 RepID=A0ABT0PFW7_9GAMM|nr:hypothetical protein [Sansalvadorimonas sp. 2012CJ34-2]MCL6270255.1 hypothetical protein [Sansalvadorimonas sp. 2012CJ34-2]